MIEVPENTVLDGPEHADLEPSARKLLKMLILDYCQKAGINMLTPAETIDTIMGLQKQGCLRIVVMETEDKDGYEMKIVTTPKGAAETWITKHS